MLLRMLAFLVSLPFLVFTLPRGDKPGARTEINPNAKNPYIAAYGKPMVSAHRSGAGLAPENTKMAVEACLNAKNFRIDVFEFDVKLTKDGTLILLHNSTFDATSNAAEVFGHRNVKPSRYTFEQLQKLNLGEKFSIDGKYPYKGLRGKDTQKNLRVAALEDILGHIEKNTKRDKKYIIELKDGLLRGRRAADELHRILKDLKLLDRTIVGTFWPLLPHYIDRRYPDMPRSASIVECLWFYARCQTGRPLGNVNYVALQIPCNEIPWPLRYINLMTKEVINYAHKYDIAVQYWTVNKEQNVRRLRDNGADAIMTDYPDMAWRVIYG